MHMNTFCDSYEHVNNLLKINSISKLAKQHVCVYINARFYLVQYTKTGKNIPNDYKYVGML
jgi:hypothetical protein